MKKVSSLLSSGLFACLLTVAPQAARANVIEPLPILPPTVGGYSLSTACAFTLCLVNGFVSNFAVTSTFGADQDTDGTAQFTGDLHQNAGGSPGAFVGTLSATANIGFIFLGRTAPHQLGTFSSILDEFDFTSSFNGHTFTGRLASQDPINPGPPSTGSTTITAITPDGPYDVSGFFDIFAEVSVDGAPFVPGPMRFASIQSPVPEPSSVLLLLTGIAGLMAAPVLRRSRRSDKV